jgi:Fur family zinc uptake transcriptional regulator
MTTHAHNPALAQDRASKLEALGRVPREVFDLLTASAAPLKAYELLWRLQERRGRRAPPSTIYRAVSVLIEQGLVHKIESRNSFVVCTASEGVHDPIFLVCERCQTVLEIDGSVAAEGVKAHVTKAGFRPRHLNFVVKGLCASCASSSARVSQVTA